MRPRPADDDARPYGILRVVGVLGPLQILAWGTTYYAIAVFGPAIVRETGWSASAVAGGLSIALVIAGLVSPRIGRTIDAHGGRRVLSAGSLVIAGGLCLLASAQSLAVYWLAWGVLGLGMALGLYDAAFAALARLFGADGRRAIAALTLFGGFASTAGWPVASLLVESVGWRGAALAFAACHLLVAAPAYLLLLPKAGRPTGSAAEPVQPAPPLGRTGCRALGFIMAAIVVNSAVFAAMSVHLLDVLGRLGLSVAGAVAVAMMVGPAQVAGRILELSLERRVDALSAGRAASVALPVSLSALGLLGPAVALPYAVLYGASNGVMTIARGAIPLMIFGPVGYGARQGQIAAASLPAQAVAPIAFAAIMEEAGVRAALLTAAALSLLSLLALLALRRGEPPPATAP